MWVWLLSFIIHFVGELLSCFKAIYPSPFFTTDLRCHHNYILIYHIFSTAVV